MPTNTDTTAERLLDLLADLQVTYYKLRHFHWMVSGDQFYTLHEKFEEMYTDFAEHIDEVAERLIAIEHAPLLTLKANIDRASVEEAGTTPDALTMTRTLADDFDKVLIKVDGATEASEEAGLRSTENALDDIRDSVDNHRWMLRRYAK